MMQVHKNWCLAALLLGGCFGKEVPLGSNDAMYGAAPDLAPPCAGNNDGQIDFAELVFPVGATVNYLDNPPGTTQTVNPAGTMGPNGPTWDLTSTAGMAYPFTLQAVSGAWFEGSFPGASYAIVADVASGLLGVYRVTPDAVYLLGFASPQPDQTLLVYDQPVVTVRFPIRLGDAFVTGAKIVNSKLDGQPFASNDTYRVAVDARGTVNMPYLAFDNTLRIHVETSQALLGGMALTHIQHLFYHECYGELGRMVSKPGETDPDFTEAAEFRRLAL